MNNIPIDPREGDRRQKALRARIEAMAKNNVVAKSLMGRFAKTGQNRGTVRAMGARAGGGTRIPQNGAVRPGALANFLQSPGFMGGHGRRPDMDFIPGPSGPRHVASPIPSRRLPGDPNVSVTGPGTGPPSDNGANQVGLDDTPFATMSGDTSDYSYFDGEQPGGNPSGMSWGAGGWARSPSIPTPGGGGTPTASNLVPLGNGAYLDMTTGVIHGAGIGGDEPLPGGFGGFGASGRR